jgi:hypothetical protein
VAASAVALLASLAARMALRMSSRKKMSSPIILLYPSDLERLDELLLPLMSIRPANNLLKWNRDARGFDAE